MSVTAARATATQHGNPKDEQTIRSRFEDFISAWNRHDASGMSSLFAEDGDMINPNGRSTRTRPEIEKVLREEHAGPFQQSRLSMKPESIRFLAPDVTVTDHSFEIAGVRDPNGKDVTLRGHLTEVLKKQGDNWYCAASRPMIPVTPEGSRH